MDAAGNDCSAGSDGDNAEIEGLGIWRLMYALHGLMAVRCFSSAVSQSTMWSQEIVKFPVSIHSTLDVFRIPDII